MFWTLLLTHFEFFWQNTLYISLHLDLQYFGILDANDDLRGEAVSPNGGGQDTGAPSGQHPIPGSLVADYESGNDTSMD